MTLTINGVDIVPFVAFGGLAYLHSDIDAPDSGRTLDAQMHRGRVASKVRLDVTCKPLTTAEVQTVLNAIKPEWVTVVYTDPMLGTNVTKTMYSNNRKASFLLHRSNGQDMWKVDTFPLIEK
jgi:hypothetical protein